MLGDEPGRFGRLDIKEAKRRVRDLGRAVRPRGRPDSAGRRPRRGRAAAGRDPQGAVPRRPHHHPRRADRRARAAGGRRAVRRPRELTAEGVTIIFISHKLDEVLAVADAITVIRAGTTVAEVKPRRRDRPPAGRADGRQRAPARPRRASRTVTDEVALEVDDVTVARARAARRSSDVYIAHPPGRDRRHRRCRGQRPDRAASRRSWASPPPTAGRIVLDGRRHHRLGHARAGASRASATSPRTASATASCSTAPLWENVMLGHQTRSAVARGPVDRPRRRAAARTNEIVAATTCARPGTDVAAARPCRAATSRS